MQRILVVPTELRARVQDFIGAHGLDLQLAGSGPCAVEVVAAGEKRECTPEILFRGGWIPCRTAFAAAGRLGIPLDRMGGLLNALEVKVRACQLGCFP